MQPRLMQTVLDGPDHRRLAEFYRELLGYSYREGSEPGTGPEPQWIEIEGPATGQRLAFQRSARHDPPDWPEHRRASTQMHLDLSVPEGQGLDDAVARARSLGAAVLASNRSDGHVVLADPAGHPFCVVVA